jgi:hypothetical protein
MRRWEKERERRGFNQTSEEEDRIWTKAEVEAEARMWLRG